MLRPILTLAILVLALGTLNAQDRYGSKLDPLIERGMKDQKIPGLAVGVVQNGRLVYSRGFGVMKLGEPAPITPDTLFHMASVTKPFIATAVMQLTELGKIDLDAPVTKYLSYFRLEDQRYKTITVRQMLTHTSGIPDTEDYHWDKPEYDDGALERYVRSLVQTRLQSEPGTKFTYSDVAYEVLGDVVSKVSGVSVEDYVDQHILKPLGMSSSTLLINKADPLKLATGYTKGKDVSLGGVELRFHGAVRAIKFYPYNRAHTPSSNLHSSVVDMARWAIANMNRGELDGHRILDSSTYDLMWQRRGPRAGKASIGISWFLGELDGEKSVFHDGGDDGFRTMLVMVPERKFAFISMANCDYMGDTLTAKLVEAAFQLSK